MVLVKMLVAVPLQLCSWLMCGSKGAKKRPDTQSGMLPVLGDIEDGHSLRSLELVLAGKSLPPKGRMVLQLISEVQPLQVFQWDSS